jgi:hypothetical protein
VGLPQIKPSFQFTIVVMLAMLMGIIVAVALFLLRPKQDNTVLIGVVFSFIMSLLALLKGQETHDIVNSRMDEFKAALEARGVIEKAGAFAKGSAAGREALANEQLAAAITPQVLPASPHEKSNIGFLKGKGVK